MGLKRDERLDEAALADASEGIRQGWEQSEQGLGRDAEEFFAEFEKAHGIPSGRAGLGFFGRRKRLPH